MQSSSLELSDQNVSIREHMQAPVYKLREWNYVVIIFKNLHS